VDRGDGRLKLASPRGSAALMSAVPSAICSRFHCCLSCSASGTSDPSGRVRAARRASVSSISASSPVTSLSSGSSRCSQRASRIASCDSAGTVSWSPSLAVYPSLNTR